ncbi:MAG: hypothetical protein HZY76_03815 [Anaerolineae bacterium]|nr:MAG: hypothetical protein HZY76_03815 [Anaerolineae bacterium]
MGHGCRGCPGRSLADRGRGRAQSRPSGRRTGVALVAVIDLPVSASLDDTAIRLDVTPVNLNADPLQRFGRSLVPYVDAWRFQNVTIPGGHDHQRDAAPDAGRLADRRADPRRPAW